MKKIVLTLAVMMCCMMAVAPGKAAEVQKAPEAVPKLRVVKVKKDSVVLKWGTADLATGYTVYQYNGKAKTFKKLKTTTKKSYTVKKNLKKNKVSQFMVQAFRTENKQKVYAPYSKIVSVCPKGSKKKNVTKVKLMGKSLTVEEGTVFRLSKTLKPASKVVSRDVTWTSSNPHVVNMTEEGTFQALRDGRSTITVSAHNGVSAKIVVWVIKSGLSPQVHKVKQVQKLKIKALSDDSLKLSWRKTRYTSGYYVYGYEGDAKDYSFKKVIKKQAKTSTVFSDLKKDTEYTFVVKGYKKKKGISVYGEESEPISGCVLEGQHANAASVGFDRKEYEVAVKKTVRLNSVIQPANVISKKLRYESADESIVTVSSGGVVTGHKVGKTYITAYTHNGLYAKVRINVVESDEYASSISVLCFHRVVSDVLKKDKHAEDEWVAPVSEFEKQMKYLHDNHYTTLSLDEFNDWYRAKRTVPKKTVVLTFDDGDYEFYYLVYPILKKYNIKATMFIIGSNTGDTTHAYEDVDNRHYLGWDKINEMKKQYPNVSFQSHTYNMHYKHIKHAVNELSLPQIYQDFETNRQQGIAHQNQYKYIAYPFGVFNPDVVYLNGKFNYTLAFDFGPGRKATRKDVIYHIPRMKINGQITMENFIKRL